MTTPEQDSWIVAIAKEEISKSALDTATNFVFVDTVNVSATVADISNDEIVEIERFNNLKNRGLISEEEFEVKKKQLLGI